MIKIGDKVASKKKFDETALSRTKNVRIRKHGGDDAYSWSLFIGGREAYSGMDRNEAEWRRRRYIESGTL